MFNNSLGLAKSTNTQIIGKQNVQLTLYRVRYVRLYWCDTWQQAVFQTDENEHTQPDLHFLLLLHIIIIKITKIVTKASELNNLDAYDYNESDVMDDSLSQSPPIGRLIGLN